MVSLLQVGLKILVFTSKFTCVEDLRVVAWREAIVVMKGGKWTCKSDVELVTSSGYWLLRRIVLTIFWNEDPIFTRNEARMAFRSRKVLEYRRSVPITGSRVMSAPPTVSDLVSHPRATTPPSDPNRPPYTK